MREYMQIFEKNFSEFHNASGNACARQAMDLNSVQQQHNSDDISGIGGAVNNAWVARERDTTSPLGDGCPATISPTISADDDIDVGCVRLLVDTVTSTTHC